MLGACCQLAADMMDIMYFNRSPSHLECRGIKVRVIVNVVVILLIDVNVKRCANLIICQASMYV